MKYELLNELSISLNDEQKRLFDSYVKLFKEYNAHTNLISKNDEKYLFEKHIFDSLAFNLFVKKYKLPENIIDIGTGGGFPSVILSLIYKNTKIYAVDSIRKKINFINTVKTELNLENLFPVVSRIENLKEQFNSKFDVVTTRALGELSLITEYASSFIKKGGYFVAYKSLNSENELNKAQFVIKKNKMKLVEIINYQLPLEENFDRKLLIFEKL